ncbi:TRAP transporter small permease [Mesorhizobium microcysteis]|uniref:TRAP transporter small permease protein n=1 Tax=Neoaquamicrobium microcysteis TaxID=2682781 RepID=A0A5D4H1K1_9HYPH|nr:TRAP transporter small permease [Mesorhizobium microcysteis]TYR33395.1 TRAP transporter small permease [Mesorhizobium microcysteis]
MRRFLDLFDKGLGHLEKTLFAVSVSALVLIAAIMITAISIRNIGLSIPDHVLITQQLMLVSIACGLGYATGQRAHIAVDLLYDRFGPKGRTAAELVAVAAGLVAVVPVALWAVGDFLAFLRSGRYYYGQLNMPEWPARLFFATGFILVWLRLTHHLLAELAGEGEVYRSRHKPHG